MEKYLEALKNLNRKFGSEWIKPAAEAVLEVAVLEYIGGTLSRSEYTAVCLAQAKILKPVNEDRI